MSDERIAQILDGLNFKRRRPVSAADKQAYARLQKDVAGVLKSLKRLHLSLWHGVARRDYHSLPLAEARRRLEAIVHQLKTCIEEKEEL